LTDLHNYIIKQYAAKWDRLGLELGLEGYEVDNISVNNAYHPNRIVQCCANMLKLWLQKYPATWSKLDDAVKKITSYTSLLLVPGTY